MSHQIALDTEDLYDARIRTLMRHAGPLEWSRPESWAQALGARKLALSSLKSYASAIRFAARRELSDAAESFVSAFNAALKPLQEGVRSSKQRSRPKHRRMAITEQTVQILREAAEWREENTRSTRARFVMDMAEGTLRFGLRPSEWSKTKIEDNRLIIPNGKHIIIEPEHGPFAGRLYQRGNGERRELIAHDEFVGKFAPILLRLSRSSPLSYRTNERGVRRAWRDVVDTAIQRFGLPSRFRTLRLYDFRHQFAANWKSSVPASSGIIAAMMGHVSVRTAVQSYARASNARGGGWGLRPSQDTLDAVMSHEMWAGYPPQATSPAKSPNKTVSSPGISNSRPSGRSR